MLLLKSDVLVEEGAGDLAAIPDKMFVEAGATISNRSNVLKADLILQVRPPEAKDLERLTSKQYVVGLLEPFNKELTKDFLDKKITAFALELLPRITRAQSMDVLSSQANIAG